MSDNLVWFLLIDHNYAPIGSADYVIVSDAISVAGLKTRIEEKTKTLPAHLLTVFQCTDPTIDLVDDDFEAGEEGTVWNKVNKVFTDKKVKKLSLKQTVANQTQHSRSSRSGMPFTTTFTSCALE